MSVGKTFYRLLEGAREKKAKRNAVQAESIRLTTRVMKAAGESNPPPNLNRLARHLGVQKIQSVPLAMSGRILVHNRTFSIEINEKLDELEHRRTLAHELAHLILEKDRIALSSNVDSINDLERNYPYALMEELCDMCGDEMLLQKDWLWERLAGHRVSLQTVMEIASETNLSVEFVATRIIALKLQRWRAIWCMKIGQNIQLVKSLPHWDEAFLASIQIVDASLIADSYESEGVSSGRVCLSICGEENTYFAQATKLNDKSVLCILHLGCGAQSLSPRYSGGKTTQEATS